MDAPMQLPRGLPWSVGNHARAGMAGSSRTPPFSLFDAEYRMKTVFAAVIKIRNNNPYVAVSAVRMIARALKLSCGEGWRRIPASIFSGLKG
jgi:hypothetical protein